jgi:uncharacterized membrane protein
MKSSVQTDGSGGAWTAGSRARRRWIAALAAVVALAAFAVGTIAASAEPPPGDGIVHGFLAKDGLFRTIDHPDAATIPAPPEQITGTATLGINDRGQVVGVYEGRDRVFRHFVRDRQGRFRIIADPPGARGDRLSYEMTDINNRGQITGFYNDERGNTTSGFLRTREGRFIDIRVPGSQFTAPLKVNDRRQVVGSYFDAAGASHGFLWEDGDYKTLDVPGAAATGAIGINNRGQIVGPYMDAEGRPHGYLRNRRGAVTTLPEAPGATAGTIPDAINDRGQIAGGAIDSQGETRGFLLERGRFTLIEGPDAVYTLARDINNRGWIVGDYESKRPVGANTSTAGRADLARGPRAGAGRDRAWLP